MRVSTSKRWMVIDQDDTFWTKLTGQADRDFKIQRSFMTCGTTCVDNNGFAKTKYPSDHPTVSILLVYARLVSKHRGEVTS